MKSRLLLAGNVLVNVVIWLLVCGAVTLAFRRWDFFTGPTVQFTVCAWLAIYNVLVVVPYAFGSREKLAVGVKIVGVSHPLVARIFCIIAMLLVFITFTTVTVLYHEVHFLFRFGGVLAVVGVGIFSWLRRTRKQAQ